jgi:hypothetical protein
MHVHSLVRPDLLGIPLARRPVWSTGTQGTRYQRWMPYGMPQLGQYSWISDTIFFLYPSVDEARAGTGFGGTGFFVAMPSEKWGADYWHVHGVTNWHVALDGAPVIRVNLRNGGTEEFDFGPEQWTFLPGWHDVAISPPLQLNPKIHKAEAIWYGSLLSQNGCEADNIGPAEDVFMVGRFIDYIGAETNEAAYRFGNVSIVNASIKQNTGFMGGSYVIDMHSRTGFSGSPIFVYRTPGSVFHDGKDIALAWHYIRLLGIHWGQFPEKWELKSDVAPKTRAESASLITDGKYVSGLSGMTCAVPAAAILLLLTDIRLCDMRAIIDEQITPDMNSYVRPRGTGGQSPIGSFETRWAIERHLGLGFPQIMGLR